MAEQLQRTRSWAHRLGGWEHLSEGNRPALACRRGRRAFCRSMKQGASLRWDGRPIRCARRAAPAERRSRWRAEERRGKGARPTAADERRRKRSRREAGARYSAGRAQRGCGRFLQHLLGNLVPGRRQSITGGRRNRHAARGHRRCRTVGNDPDAKPVRGTPRAGRTRLRSLPSAVILGTSRIVGSMTTKPNERPAPLGAGARRSERIELDRIEKLDRAYPARRRHRPPPPNQLKPLSPPKQHKEIYQNYLQSRPETARRAAGKARVFNG